jgi:hypothetical protein
VLNLDKAPDALLRALARTSGKTLRLAVPADPAMLGRLERTGALAMVSTLRADCPDRCVEKLAASEQLVALERLELTCLEDAPVTATTARALARARMPRLRALTLAVDRETCVSDKPLGIGAAGVRALLGAPWVSGLEELNLLVQGIGDTGALAIARSPALAGLRTLGITGDPLHAPAVRELLSRSVFAERLQRLTLSKEEIDGAPPMLDGGGLRALARARLPALEQLEIYPNRIDDSPAGRALAAAPWRRRTFVVDSDEQPTRPDEGGVQCSGPRSWKP